MSTKFKVLLSVLATMAFVACAQNSEQHAPVCIYGQILTYTASGYSCNNISLVPAGLTGVAQNATPPQPGQQISSPVQSCGNPSQVLIDWQGTFLCYQVNEIYPSNGNSPQSLTPPPGWGGEFCTSAGMPVYPAMNGVNPYAAMASTVVSCSPGFTCQAGGAGAANAASAMGPFSVSYGQPGTCVYSGYQGTY